MECEDETITARFDRNLESSLAPEHLSLVNGDCNDVRTYPTFNDIVIAIPFNKCGTEKTVSILQNISEPKGNLFKNFFLKENISQGLITTACKIRTKHTKSLQFFILCACVVVLLLLLLGHIYSIFQNNASHIIYRNFVRHEVPPADPVISRRTVYRIEVMCVLERSQQSENGVQPVPQTAPPARGDGQFDVRMLLYTNNR